MPVKDPTNCVLEPGMTELAAAWFVADVDTTCRLLDAMSAVELVAPGLDTETDALCWILLETIIAEDPEDWKVAPGDDDAPC
jgi:hypothetical protein